MSANIEQELQARGVAQVIVVVNDPAPPAAAAAPSGTVSAQAGGAVVGALAKHFRSSEMSLGSQIASAAASGRSMRASARAGMAGPADQPWTSPPARYYPHLGVMLGTVDRQGFEALKGDARASRVVGAPVLSLIRPSRVAAASPSAKTTWGIRAMRVPTLWKQGIDGKDILVGHLDTGADGAHPALNGAILHFAEFDDLGREVAPSPPAFDTDEHGTHTAATIAGRPVNGRHVGVAPGAVLASAVVIEGGDVVARVLGGMDWTVGNGVRVLSMSLGFRGFFEDFVPLTQILRARNILPVFAVGNEGTGTSRSPGNYSEALSVGAHDRALQVADFSSSQRFARVDDPLVPDLVAPGVEVVSARPGGGFQLMDGSSMATPHVAGLAALLMQARPAATADQVETAIFQSCRLASTMLPERANRGVPDAPLALSLL